MESISEAGHFHHGVTLLQWFLPIYHTRWASTISVTHFGTTAVRFRPYAMPCFQTATTVYTAFSALNYGTADGFIQENCKGKCVNWLRIDFEFNPWNPLIFSGFYLMKCYYGMIVKTDHTFSAEALIIMSVDISFILSHLLNKGDLSVMSG